MPACSPKRFRPSPDSSASASCTTRRAGSPCRRPDQLRRPVPWPAIRAADDPDEEVGREEGPEDDHLGDDEKQHAEQPALDARGVGRPSRGRDGLVVVDGDRGGSIRRVTSSFASMRWTAPPFCWSFSTRPFSTHAPSGWTAASRRRAWGKMWKQLQRVHGPLPCTGRGRRSCPRRRSSRPAATHAAVSRCRAASTARPSPDPCGTDDDEAVRALLGELLEALDQLVAGGDRYGDTSVTSKGRPSESTSTTMRSYPGCRSSQPLGRSRRSDSRVTCSVETNDPVDVDGLGRTCRWRRQLQSASALLAVPRSALVLHEREREVEPAPARSRTASL